MATITLHKEKINGVGGLIDSIVKSSNKLDTQLGTLRNTLQGVDSSTCNLQGVVSSISSSSKSEKEKVADLKRLNSKLTDFITMTARRDADAKSAVERSKNDFYSKYSYLKPECEKNAFEHICDGLQSVGEWCKEHWKLIVVAILVVVAIVVIVVTWGAATGPLLLLAGAAKGLLAGALIGGLMGGASSALTGGSFLDGFENGAFSGAIMGALTGALGGAGQLLGGSCKVLGALGTVAKYMPSIAKITGGLSLAMGVFDLASFGIGMFDPNNPIVLLNQNLHSSTAYNVFQIGVTAVAVFSGGFAEGMKHAACFIAGTMILTAEGLVAIENIKKGDMVIATDPETDITEPKAVLETYIRETSHLVHLTVCGETIASTFDHPYYVKDEGFVNACDLWIGAELVDNNGHEHLVEQLYREDLDESSVKVFNFKVEDHHTYFVGETSILVHNANYPSHMNEDGSLKPNTEYTTGEYDYKYKTDNQGRIKHFETDKLHMKKHEGRLPHASNTPDKLPTDHAGHIIADQFGGSPNLDNIISQDGNLNTHAYRDMERSWANAINNGQQVTDVRIDLTYPKGSSRPSSFKVTYKIDGIKSTRRFIN